MFNSLLAEHKTPFGAVAAGEEMTLRFTLPQGDPRTPSLLLYRAGQPQPLLHTPLCRQGDAFTLRYTPREPGLYYYGFRLSDGPMAAPITASGSFGILPSTIRPTIFRKNSPGR